MRASLDVTENSCLEAAGRTHLELVHRPPGVLPPTIVERKAALSPDHHLAPADHGLNGFLLFVQSPRTAAGLSIDARAAAVLGLALRKEIALLPIAAEKIPRLGAVDVREGDSAARERCAGDPVGEVVNQEFLRRGKEPVAARYEVDGLHGWTTKDGFLTRRGEEINEEENGAEERREAQGREDGVRVGEACDICIYIYIYIYIYVGNGRAE